MKFGKFGIYLKAAAIRATQSKEQINESLVKACRENHAPSRVETLLLAGANANYTGPENSPRFSDVSYISLPLYFASDRGNQAIISLLHHSLVAHGQPPLTPAVARAVRQENRLLAVDL